MIVMLIVVPLLNVKETDNTQSLAVQLVQNMAVYNYYNTTVYAVRLYYFTFYLSLLIFAF